MQCTFNNGIVIMVIADSIELVQIKSQYVDTAK